MPARCVSEARESVMDIVRNRRRVGGRSLAAALLGTTFLVGFASPALADGHLEAENAELRSMIEELRQELEILKNVVLQQNSKNLEQDEAIAGQGEAIVSQEELLASQGEALAAAAEPAPPAQIVTSGKDKVSLSLSGQVNRMLLLADDGDESRLFHADNDMSSTRLALKGKADMDNGWTAGATIEVQIESNSSSKVTIDQTKAHGDFSKPGGSHTHETEVPLSNDDITDAQDTNTDDPTLAATSSKAGGEGSDVVSFTERKLEVWFKNENIGKFSLGQGSTASDGTIEEDLSGTGVISGAGFGGAIGADIRFTDMAGNRHDKVDGVFDNMDGLSRADRIRYDSPSFEGVQVSGSWLGDQYDREDETVESGAWDLALRYGREFEGYEVAAAISRWTESADTTGHGGSVSFLMPSGTSVTGSFATTETDGAEQDPEFKYLKLGQEFEAIDAGKTAVSIGYSSTDNQGDGDSSGSHYDLALVQKIKDLGTELYAVYGVYDADIIDGDGLAVPTDKVTVTGVGARIKF